jgi:hypothetical protein
LAQFVSSREEKPAPLGAGHNYMIEGFLQRARDSASIYGNGWPDCLLERMRDSGRSLRRLRWKGIRYLYFRRVLLGVEARDQIRMFRHASLVRSYKRRVRFCEFREGIFQALLVALRGLVLVADVRNEVADPSDIGGGLKDEPVKVVEGFGDGHKISFCC